MTVPTTVDGVRPPLAVRLLLGADSALRRVGIPREYVDFDRMRAKAEHRTRLSNYSDPQFLADLDTLTGFVNRYPQTTAVSTIAFRGDLMRRLTNNLKLQAAKKRHPDLTAQPLERPILIAGLPRTGTTLMQRLLSRDPASHGPALWELHHPVRIDEPHGDDHARRVTDRFVRQVKGISKDLWDIHPSAADEPDECYYLLPQCSGDFALYAGQDYFEWFLSRSAVPDYRLYREYLQAMHYGRLPSGKPLRRWVLKSPLHMPKLDDMLTVFPDACVVQCHRNLSDVVASWISFIVVTRMHGHRQPDIRQTTREWFDTLALGAKAVDQARDKRPPGQWFDVNYPEFIADPLAMVERIYAHFGIEMTGAARSGMAAWYALQRQQHKTSHRYALEQFGLTTDDLKRAFGEYIDRYGVQV